MLTRVGVMARHTPGENQAPCAVSLLVDVAATLPYRPLSRPGREGLRARRLARVLTPNSPAWTRPALLLSAFGAGTPWHSMPCRPVNSPAPVVWLCRGNAND